MTEADPALLADAIEELLRQPSSPAIQAAIRALEEVPRVEGLLRRRRALRLLDELWASGEVWTWTAAEQAVASRVGAAPSTVRVWRWERNVFGSGKRQQTAGEGDARKEGE